MDFIIQFILPFFYIILLAWLLQRNEVFRKNGFTKRFIVLFFLAKCFVGIAYNYIEIKYIPRAGDIFNFSGDGLHLYHTFLKSPAAGFEELRKLFGFRDMDLMNSKSTFVNGAFAVLKFIYFILDFFSFGDLFTDTILFNGLATMAFLHGWVFLKKNIGSPMAGGWIYLMPSVFFYTSSISKEGVPYILMSVLLVATYQLSKSLHVLRLAGCIVLFGLLFIMKFLIAFTFLGGLGFWFITIKFPGKRSLMAGLVILFTIAAFFSLGIISPKLNFPQYFVNRQQEFLALEANSKIPVAVLSPDFYSFLKALPTALKNVFFKPLPGEGGKAMYFAFSIEMLSFWGLLLFLLVKNKFRINFGAVPPLVWGLFLFAMANLLIVGYIVPNIGAITRYRSIFLPFVGLFFWLALNGDNNRLFGRWLSDKH